MTRNNLLPRRSTTIALAAALFVSAGPNPGRAEAPAPLPEGFVRLAAIDPTIRQDIRYAGPYNFIKRKLDAYEASVCILTEQAARALKAVQDRLREGGETLVVFDCYRPERAVRDMVGWVGEGGPTDPRWYPKTRRSDLIRKGYVGRRSAHSRGSTVDLAIAPLEGPAVDPGCGAGDVATLDFGTGFDCFDPKSATATTAVGKNARSNRRRLVALMRDANFRNYAAEWWHFTLQNEPFSSRRFDFPVK